MTIGQMTLTVTVGRRGLRDWLSDWVIDYLSIYLSIIIIIIYLFIVCSFLFHTLPQFSKHFLSPIFGNAKMNRTWLLPPRAHIVSPHFFKSALRLHDNLSSAYHLSNERLWALSAFGLTSSLLDVLCFLLHWVLIMTHLIIAFFFFPCLAIPFYLVMELYLKPHFVGEAMEALRCLW